MKFQFCYCPELHGLPFALILGEAETVWRKTDRGTYWTVSRIMIHHIDGSSATLSAGHWMHDPLMLWLLTTHRRDIDALWAEPLAVAS